jgi:hypothetical protein
MLAMKRRLAILAIVTLCTLAPLAVSALGLQTVVPVDCTNKPGGCQSICDIAVAAQNLLDDGIYVAIFLSAILFAWAGWNMVVGSSYGDVAKVTHARRIFMYVTGGLVLILSAWVIVSVIMATLTNNTSWNGLCASSSNTTITNITNGSGSH